MSGFSSCINSTKGSNQINTSHSKKALHKKVSDQLKLSFGTIGSLTNAIVKGFDEKAYQSAKTLLRKVATGSKENIQNLKVSDAIAKLALNIDDKDSKILWKELVNKELGKIFIQNNDTTQSETYKLFSEHVYTEVKALIRNGKIGTQTLSKLKGEDLFNTIITQAMSAIKGEAGELPTTPALTKETIKKTDNIVKIIIKELLTTKHNKETADLYHKDVVNKTKKLFTKDNKTKISIKKLYLTIQEAIKVATSDDYQLSNESSKLKISSLAANTLEKLALKIFTENQVEYNDAILAIDSVAAKVKETLKGKEATAKQILDLIKEVTKFTINHQGLMPAIEANTIETVEEKVGEELDNQEDVVVVNGDDLLDATTLIPQEPKEIEAEVKASPTNFPMHPELAKEKFVALARIPRLVLDQNAQAASPPNIDTLADITRARDEQAWKDVVAELEEQETAAGAKLEVAADTPRSTVGFADEATPNEPEIVETEPAKTVEENNLAATDEEFLQQGETVSDIVLTEEEQPADDPLNTDHASLPQENENGDGTATKSSQENFSETNDAAKTPPTTPHAGEAAENPEQEEMENATNEVASTPILSFRAKAPTPLMTPTPSPQKTDEEEGMSPSSSLGSSAEASPGHPSPSSPTFEAAPLFGHERSIPLTAENPFNLSEKEQITVNIAGPRIKFPVQKELITKIAKFGLTELSSSDVNIIKATAFAKTGTKFNKANNESVMKMCQALDIFGSSPARSELPEEATNLAGIDSIHHIDAELAG